MWYKDQVIDDTYVIMNELGQGGTGVIYLAYHTRLCKYVVLKRIKNKYKDILKVRTEVDILKQLRHTYLPQVYDFMQYGDDIYTVIDYIDGCDLENYIKSGYVFSQDQLIAWLRQLCDVLDYLHSRKPRILHCDIKPGNVMITTDGNVCLIDFNISLDETDEGLSGISQYYASPEQYEKAAAIINRTQTAMIIDQRTDIYSLGATFYHMISGVVPRGNAYNTPLSQMGLNGHDPEFLQIIDRMMAYDPSMRPKSAKEIVMQIDRMFKRDKAFSGFIKGFVHAVLAYTAVMVAGIWMCTHGSQLINVENYNSDYSVFEKYYASGDFDNAVSRGIDILNNGEYSSVMESKDRFSLLYGIGECYYNTENYTEACRYYKDALKLDSDDKSPCLRDYAIALIQSGDDAGARSLLDSMDGDLLGEKDIMLVDAALRQKEGDHYSAAEKASALFDSPDEAVSSRARIIASEAYLALGEYSRAIDALEALVARDPSIINLRRLGDAYIKYGEAESNNRARHDQCYRGAKECYEKLASKEFCSFADLINAGVICMELGEYDNALTYLNRAGKEKEDYRVYMYTAFCHYERNDMNNARSYCISAVSLYEKTPVNEKESASSDNIQTLYSLNSRLR